MALNTTVKQLRELLGQLSGDLEKAALGNKAAAQRVRTGTIRLEKLAKVFRKESITAEKKGTLKKVPAKKKAAAKKKPAAKKKTAAKKKPAAKKTAAKKKPVAKKKVVAKKTTAKKKPVRKTATKAKTTAKKATTRARSRALTLRRATAKLPARRRAR